MKTINSKFLSWKRLNKVLVGFALAATVGLTACQNSSGSSGVTPVYPGALPPGVAPCNGCPSNMGYLASAIGKSFDPFANRIDVEMGIDFFADMNLINQYAGMLPGFGGFSYQGPVMAAGVMNVLSPSPSCLALKPGTYSIQTIAGQWGTIGPRSFELYINLVGPEHLQAYISGDIKPATPPAFDAGGKQYPYQFTGYQFELVGPWGYCNLSILLQ